MTEYIEEYISSGALLHLDGENRHGGLHVPGLQLQREAVAGLADCTTQLFVQLGSITHIIEFSREICWKSVSAGRLQGGDREGFQCRPGFLRFGDWRRKTGEIILFL